jgi:hypothetical protein
VTLFWAPNEALFRANVMVIILRATSFFSVLSVRLLS